MLLADITHQSYTALPLPGSLSLDSQLLSEAGRREGDLPKAPPTPKRQQRRQPQRYSLCSRPLHRGGEAGLIPQRPQPHGTSGRTGGALPKAMPSELGLNPKHEGELGKDLVSFLCIPKPWPEPRAQE